jgi:hypothetical protein
MDSLKVIDLILTVIVIILLFYVIVIVTPKEQALLKECKEKVLCKNQMLTGSICDKYYSSSSPMTPK